MKVSVDIFAIIDFKSSYTAIAYALAQCFVPTIDASTCAMQTRTYDEIEPHVLGWVVMVAIQVLD